MITHFTLQNKKTSKKNNKYLVNNSQNKLRNSFIFRKEDITKKKKSKKSTSMSNAIVPIEPCSFNYLNSLVNIDQSLNQITISGNDFELFKKFIRYDQSNYLTFNKILQMKNFFDSSSENNLDHQDEIDLYEKKDYNNDYNNGYNNDYNNNYNRNNDVINVNSPHKEEINDSFYKKNCVNDIENDIETKINQSLSSKNFTNEDFNIKNEKIMDENNIESPNFTKKVKKTVKFYKDDEIFQDKQEIDTNSILDTDVNENIYNENKYNENKYFENLSTNFDEIKNVKNNVKIISDDDILDDINLDSIKNWLAPIPSQFNWRYVLKMVTDRKMHSKSEVIEFWKNNVYYNSEHYKNYYRYLFKVPLILKENLYLQHLKSSNCSINFENEPYENLYQF